MTPPRSRRPPFARASRPQQSGGGRAREARGRIHPPGCDFLHSLQRRPSVCGRLAARTVLHSVKGVASAPIMPATATVAVTKQGRGRPDGPRPEVTVPLSATLLELIEALCESWLEDYFDEEGGGVHEHLWRVMVDGKVYECDSFVEHGSGKVLAASSKQLNRLNDFGPGKKLEWVYDSVDFGLTVVSTQ